MRFYLYIVMLYMPLLHSAPSAWGSFFSTHIANLKPDNPIKSSSVANFFIKLSQIPIIGNNLSLLPKRLPLSSFMVYNLRAEPNVWHILLLKKCVPFRGSLQLIQVPIHYNIFSLQLPILFLLYTPIYNLMFEFVFYVSWNKL